MMDHISLRLSFKYKLARDKKLRDRVKEIMESQVPENGTHNHPVEHKSLSGHHITMLSRYIIALSHIEGRVVLDTGCGLGWGSYILSLRAKEVMGIDINETSISYAISNWEAENLIFEVYDVMDLYKFPDDAIDVVTSMELIEHFDQIDGLRYFQEVFRVLRPGGTFFGSSGFTDDDTERESMMADPEHKHIYSESEFKRILEETIGFKEVVVTDNWLFLARR